MREHRGRATAGRWWAGWLGMLLLVGAVPLAWTAERVALVIGNGRYQNAPRLSNPANDAKAVAGALADMGFAVTGPLYDLKKADLDAALGRFGKQAQAAEAVVVFFAGHGLEARGRNYLIPVDAQLEREAAASLEAVALDVVLDQIAGPRGYRLVILDACRDNPLANRMQRSDGTRATYRGLRRVEPEGQTYVAYAAKDNTRALDDGGGGHSPFTAALLKYLKQPLPLPNLFGAVREDVLEATQHRQEPWLYGAFGRHPVYLSASPTPAPPAPVATASVPSPFRPPAPQEAPAAGSRPQVGQIFRDTLSDGTRGPALVVIPSGDFWMGSPKGEVGRDSDERRHRVKIEQAFALGQNEITVGEFKRFVEATSYRTDAERDLGEKGCYAWSATDGKWAWRVGLNWGKPGYEQEDRYPVVCVSWNDALAYGKWLSAQTGQAYRLPTEAEWEYAARAGTTTARYWGDDPDQACRYANVADQTLAWNNQHDCTDGHWYSAPVGSFEPNAWNLFDVLGNVWEWTCSLYDQKYSGAEAQCTNKTTSAPRLLRGGSWSYRPAGVRSAYRDWFAPTSRSNLVGFRLARSL